MDNKQHGVLLVGVQVARFQKEGLCAVVQLDIVVLHGGYLLIIEAMEILIRHWRVENELVDQVNFKIVFSK